MALRKPISQLCKHASPPSFARASALSSRHAAHTIHTRYMATVVPPVTQDMTSSKGPTAMVFMNMGGPSTTDEVGNFLSRLFVSTPHSQTYSLPLSSLGLPKLNLSFPTGRRRPHSPRPSPELPRSSHISPPYPKDSKTVCCHRRWLSHPQVVRVSILRNVQTPRSNITRNRPSQTVRRFPLRRSID